MASLNELKIKGLCAMGMQYDFLDALKDCEDAISNPQYFTAQVDQLRGMREMYDAIFGDAPYTKAACKAMLDEMDCKLRTVS